MLMSRKGEELKDDGNDKVVRDKGGRSSSETDD